MNDIQYALRSFLRTPSFFIAATTALALGIGANTALFSVVDALILRSLPFHEPAQLVRVTADLRKQNISDIGIGVLEMRDLRDRSGLFEGVAGLYPVNGNLTEVETPERIEGQLVGESYFKLFGVEAQLGRVFGPEDYTPGNGEIAVIKHSGRF